MKQVQRGFTLIELVMVIVILGILSAVAIPKFVDLSSDAKLAALSGTAGALSSAASINYAGCAANNHVAATNKCVQVAKCSDVGALLNPPVTLTATCSTSSHYITADSAIAGTGADKNGGFQTCTLNYGSGSTCASGGAATFTIIGAAN